MWKCCLPLELACICINLLIKTITILLLDMLNQEYHHVGLSTDW
jgi:hypothetical protein